MSRIYQQAACTVSWLGSDALIPRAASEFNTSKSQGVAALAQTLNNEYFTRLWIVQDVLLAQ